MFNFYVVRNKLPIDKVKQIEWKPLELLISLRECAQNRQLNLVSKINKKGEAY